MPHQCVHCAAIYGDGAQEILKGCTCGSRFFFYITAEKMKKLQETREDLPLSTEERKQIEEDVREIIGVEEEHESPIILDFESIKVLKPGKYVIDLHNLFNKERPLVYTLEEGKYVVDLTSQVASREKPKKKTH